MFAICQFKQDVMIELKCLAFTMKNMENLKPIPQKPHSTTYQQVKKSFAVEEGDKLYKPDVEGIAGVH